MTVLETRPLNAQIWQREEWRIIPSFPKYLASSLGRIRGPSGKILQMCPGRGGYFRITAYKNRHAYSGSVNRFVCEAFHGPAPTAEHEAAHWDGIRTNNLPGNLRWATTLENCHDKKRHGTWRALSAHPRAQLNEDQVREIKEIYAKNRPGNYVKRGTREQLAEKFGVKISLIKDIIQNRCWRTV